MKIIFLKNHLDHKKDSVIEVTDDRANYLIRTKVAVKQVLKDKKK